MTALIVIIVLAAFVAGTQAASRIPDAVGKPLNERSEGRLEQLRDDVPLVRCEVPARQKGVVSAR